MKIPSKAKKAAGDDRTNRIRTARRRADVSQTMLARTLGVSASAVAQWEHPEGTQPSIDHLVRLAEITGVSLEWLITGRSATGGKAHAPADTPALALDAYARDMHEETLLTHFRGMSARGRSLLLQFADEFATVNRTSRTKRR